MHGLVAVLAFAFAFLLLPHGHGTSCAAANIIPEPCNRRCGRGQAVPYPFGFSAGCPIPLSCDAANGSTPTLPSRAPNGGTSSYRVVLFNAPTFVVAVPPSCDRAVEQARAALSGPNYGVSARTGLFLRGGGGGCRAPPNASACSVPAGVMSRLLRTAQCRGGATGNGTSAAAVACVASAAAQDATAEAFFLGWDKAEGMTECDDVLTSAVYVDDAAEQGTAGSLEFGVAELGWWLDGTCAAAAKGAAEGCAANAECADVRAPGGKAGHRCACAEGMDGDGYFLGDGCYYPRAKTSKKTVAFIIGVSPEQHTTLPNGEHLKKKKNTGCATRWSATSAASSPGTDAASMSRPSTTASRRGSTATARSGQVSTQRRKDPLQPPNKVKQRTEFMPGDR